ncbi:tautomerase family protein [Gilliamella sp. CG16]
MPHINIISWPISDDEKAKKLLEEITVATHKILGCPIDKISISLQEVSPSR